MKISIQCDGCGTIGTAQEIGTDHDGRDLCHTCAAREEIGRMKAKHADKLKWLEATHLKDLRDLEKQIAAMEAAVRAAAVHKTDPCKTANLRPWG